MKKSTTTKKQHFKQILLLSIDIFFICLAMYLSLAINLGGELSSLNQRIVSLNQSDIYIVLLTIFFSINVFIRIGLYRSIIRYMGQKAFITILLGVIASTFLLGASLILVPKILSVPSNNLVSTVPFNYLGLLFIFIGGSRLLIWLHYQRLLDMDRVNVAIYGAGSAGRQLCTTFNHSDNYKVKFFIDDNANLVGRIINGIKVYHPDEIASIIATTRLSQILLALPSIARSKRGQIIQKLEAYPVQVMTIPRMEDIVSGKAKIEEILEIDIDDLLGRDTISPNKALFDRCIKGKVVLVTGAGGSIGSELCRQILKHEPAHLILFELSEFALYSLEQELKPRLTQHIKLTALLGSVQSKTRLQSIFTVYGVNTIYHAAAYKHVPIVEENIVEGIRNNIFGTYKAAQAALASGVETFVLISTDKAVHPTNVMGATKRFSEMVLQAMASDISCKEPKTKLLSQQDSSDFDATRFCMVRFGNVLGSSGSVVPLFKKQIKQGGPVTVTHRDIERYFMSTQEATQLVLQAGAMGQGGDVFVLDMGKLVKITDLAKKMIHLSGYEVQNELNPNGDIRIEYTGLRPGEKLYEELLIGNNVSGTEHKRIMRAEEKMLSLKLIEEKLNLLDEACNDFNVAWIREILLDSETGYVPDNPKPVDLLWCQLNKENTQ